MPLLLGALVLALMAVADKLYGLVQRPFMLATAAYVLLLALLAWSTFGRGRAARRLSAYTACLLFLLATTSYVLAWKVSSDPTPVILLNQLDRADEYIEAGELDTALLGLRELNRRFPRTYGVLSRLGAAQYRQGAFHTAVRHFTLAIEIAPPDQRWRAMVDLGQTYWQLGEPDQAIDRYLKARRLGVPAAELPLWHYRMAEALFDLEQYDEAIPEYETVAQSGGEYAAASLYNIACALAQMKASAGNGALAKRAVQYLREAWSLASSAEDRDAMRIGLIGEEGERDPELDPLRKEPGFQEFVAELLPAPDDLVTN